MKTKIPKSLMAEAHRRQLNGEDWQSVAVDLIDQVKNATDDDFKELCSSPDPGCECGFCAEADFL